MTVAAAAAAAGEGGGGGACAYATPDVAAAEWLSRARRSGLLAARAESESRTRDAAKPSGSDTSAAFAATDAPLPPLPLPLRLMSAATADVRFDEVLLALVSSMGCASRSDASSAACNSASSSSVAWLPFAFPPPPLAARRDERSREVLSFELAPLPLPPFSPFSPFSLLVRPLSIDFIELPSWSRAEPPPLFSLSFFGGCVGASHKQVMARERE